VSTGTSHTFNLPTASATKRGALSSTDWTTFNNKVNISDTSSMLSPYLRKIDTISLINRINLKVNISDTLSMLSPYLRNNIASATYLLKSDSSIYYTKYRSDTSRNNIYNAINNKQASGTYVTSVTGTSPISSTGGTTPAISISQATSSTSGYVSASDFSNISEGPVLAGLQLLGSSFKGITLTIPDFKCNTSGTLTSGTLYLVPVYIPVSTTITGIKFQQITQGVYTANNYNGVGLYSVSSGTLTLQASSTNDGNIWKGTAAAWQTKAFSSTYSASAGVYYIGFIYSSSAQTTAPIISSSTNTTGTNSMLLDLTNSNKLSASIATQTSLPSPQAMSGTTNSNNMWGIFIY
jgi:hypothetical protein